MTEFEFDRPDWALAIDALRSGTTFSALQFLTLLERESEEDFEEALVMLSDKDIALDVSELPTLSDGSDLATRLARERQLVQEQNLPEGLEENDPLRLYLQELQHMDAHDDVHSLVRRSLDGDEKARLRLMDQMLPRVQHHAFALVGRSMLLMDLIQEGSLGLWQAILTYQSGDFESYCDRRVQYALAAAMTHQAREQGVGMKLLRSMERYRSTDQRLLTELGHNPTMEEIAAELNMTLEEAELVLQTLEAARTLSRTREAAQPREETPEDSMSVEDTAYFQMRQRISELLSVLSAEDAQILTLRFGLEGALPLTPEETGRRMGLTAQQVLQREAAALAQLREL